MKNESTIRGRVTEVLPNAQHRVELEDGREMICYESGKIRRNKIRILAGDTVSIVPDPYGGKTTNRIIRRL